MKWTAPPPSLHADTGPEHQIEQGIFMRIFTLCVLSSLALGGCLGGSLGEVRASHPLQSGIFQMPYEQMADCTKARVESDPWLFGQPIVQIARIPNQPLISVYAIYSRSTLFELTFKPISPRQTSVEYRRSYDGHGTQTQAWKIVEQCSH